MGDAVREPAAGVADVRLDDLPPHRKWWHWIRWVMVGLVVAGFAAAAMTRSEPDGLARARSLLEEDRSFATATDAGVAFTRISIALQDAGESCGERDGRGGNAATSPPRCPHLFAAAAYSRVAAVQVLPCTRRGVAEARSALRSYLRRLQADVGTVAPPLPECSR